MSWKSLLFSFNGRISRNQFWQANIGLVLLGLAAAAAVYVWTIAIEARGTAHDGVRIFDPQDPLELLLFALSMALVGLCLWAILAVAVKRLHDRSRQGAWALVLVIIPPLGLIWWIVELGMWSGTAGSNRYGPPAPSA